MNTSYAMDAYRAHDLNITMRTSSGDTIELDFANHQSTSMSHKKTENGSQTSMSFSSMQSFQFKVDSNGIDEQDRKEIAAFMKEAQPYIDSFIEELQDVAPKSPVTQLAQKVASIFEPSKLRDENQINNIKSNIVKMFDNSLEKIQTPNQTEQLEDLDSQKLIEKILKDAQKLLEKTLEEFDNFNKKLYA